jgi:hypothetical protein
MRGERLGHGHRSSFQSMQFSRYRQVQVAFDSIDPDNLEHNAIERHRQTLEIPICAAESATECSD